jgi:cytidylate kinase
MKKLTIAIDGHSSCGKSTVAKQLAAKLNYSYVDTGAMYRCVTLFAYSNDLIISGLIDESALVSQLNQIQIHFQFNEEIGKSETFLNNQNVENEIRSLKISEMVSPIAKIKEVRAFLVEQQQKMGEQGAIVMDGRDIGTVVFPNADLKIFMTASVEVRANRRFLELSATDTSINIEEIKKNIEERDFIDSNREESPLRKADDAYVLDNSYLTREEQLDWILNKVNQLMNN